MTPTFRPTLSLPLAILLLGLNLLGCSDTADPEASRFGGQGSAVAVMTEPAQLSDLSETLTSVGTARALKSVSIYAETSGRVTAVAIDADSSVLGGDVPLQLDDRD